ncbi:hypothetical protein ATANTOWER_014716 [Ataeniobius toweri]|uniref:Uncharacterized protein n=1 Tax=Ataeniobius toweri TaxID=208326 RepID=A0ABU7BPR5_9TELE|nr:hypothetical protein [Ataeniobius toweri]
MTLSHAGLCWCREGGVAEAVGRQHRPGSQIAKERSFGVKPTMLPEVGNWWNRSVMLKLSSAPLSTDHPEVDEGSQRISEDQWSPNFSCLVLLSET